MNEPVREYEDTWEEVVAHEAELRGHQVKLTILDGGVPMQTQQTADAALPKRPEPTPEQARLGIMPAAIGDGSFQSIMQIVQAIHDADPEWDEAVNSLWDAIAESRAERRKMAAEKK